MTVEHPRIHWLADPASLAPIALLVFVYVRRFLQVRRTDGPRGATALHALAFAGAILALLAALVSPIDALGEEYLFSAHMLQHVLLGDIAPLLLLLSLSRVMMRPLTRRLMGIERALGPLASPVTAIVIWLGTMYLWHIPALYDAALSTRSSTCSSTSRSSPPGIALWWPLVQPIPMRRSLTGLQPLAYIAAAKGSLAALGLVLAWSSTAFYPFYEDVPRIWNLSAVEDQNVAGAIMMVEQSMTLVLVLVWVVRADAHPLRGGGAPARALGGGSSSRVERRCDQHRALIPEGPLPLSACTHIKPHPRSPPRRRPGASGNWSVQQLTGFLAMVSSAEDERTASRVAVERAAEALGADLAVLIQAGDVVASVGFAGDPVVEAALADIAEGTPPA